MSTVAADRGPCSVTRSPGLVRHGARARCELSTAFVRHLRRGEILGLVGESGCGKSTLGRGMIGLLPRRFAPATASCASTIEDLRRMPSRPSLRALRGAELGMIFQEPMTRFNPMMRISDHFVETLKIHDPSSARARWRLGRSPPCGVMGIPPTRFHHYPHEFSGGMRQRMMIALVLVLRPAFVVADEPTTSLDVLVEAQILRILADLKENSTPRCC